MRSLSLENFIELRFCIDSHYAEVERLRYTLALGFLTVYEAACHRAGKAAFKGRALNLGAPDAARLRYKSDMAGLNLHPLTRGEIVERLDWSAKPVERLDVQAARAQYDLSREKGFPGLREAILQANRDPFDLIASGGAEQREHRRAIEPPPWASEVLQRFHDAITDPRFDPDKAANWARRF